MLSAPTQDEVADRYFGLLRRRSIWRWPLWRQSRRLQRWRRTPGAELRRWRTFRSQQQRWSFRAERRILARRRRIFARRRRIFARRWIVARWRIARWRRTWAVALRWILSQRSNAA